MKKVKIAILVVVQEWGGCEVHAAQLTRTLIGQGHDARIVALTRRSHDLYREHCEDELPIVLEEIPRTIDRMRLRHWLRFFGRRDWDICVLIKGAFSVGSWQLDAAARMRFGRYVVIEQLAADAVPRTSRKYFGFLPGPGLWWRRALLRGRLRGLAPHAVICVSDAVRRMLISEFHFPKKKLHVVWNGIDTDKFLPDSDARSATRRRFGIEDRTLVVGAVGRFAPMKGYTVAIEGFRKLLAKHPHKDMVLLLVGQGDLETELRTQAAGISPLGRVIFRPFDPAPWRVLPAIDIFIMPSTNEGLPLALVEAMSCGCCPVASRAGGIPELLVSPDLGWLVPVGADLDFHDAMNEAASSSPELLAAMGASARQHAVQNFHAPQLFMKCAAIVAPEGSV